MRKKGLINNNSIIIMNNICWKREKSVFWEASSSTVWLEFGMSTVCPSIKSSKCWSSELHQVLEQQWHLWFTDNLCKLAAEDDHSDCTAASTQKVQLTASHRFMNPRDESVVAVHWQFTASSGQNTTSSSELAKVSASSFPLCLQLPRTND